MSDSTYPIQCDSCGASNSSDARFCQKCGGAVSIKINKCKQCGTSNELGAVFCKECGVKLSEARLGVTAERADQWWAFLNELDFFDKLWSDRGTGWKVHNQCGEIFRASKYPDIQWEGLAFAIPITSSDWCIKLLEWGQWRITYGEILGATTELIILDLKGKKARKIPYEQIESIDVDGWIQLLHITDGTAIKLHVKENSDSSMNRSLIFGTIGSFISIFSSQSEGAADREARFNNIDWEIKRFEENRDMGIKFWTRIQAFFNEVLSHV